MERLIQPPKYKKEWGTGDLRIMALQADIKITSPYSSSFSTVVHVLHGARPIIVTVPILGPCIVGYKNYYEWVGRLGDFIPRAGVYEYTFLSGEVYFVSKRRKRVVFRLDNIEKDFLAHPLLIWFPFRKGQVGSGFNWRSGGRCPFGDIYYEITDVIYV